MNFEEILGNASLVIEKTIHFMVNAGYTANEVQEYLEFVEEHSYNQMLLKSLNIVEKKCKGEFMIEDKSDVVKMFEPILDILDLKVNYDQETEILEIINNIGETDYISIAMDSNKYAVIDIIKGLKRIICDNE